MGRPGGAGARPAQDGLSATPYPSGVRNVPVEATEAITPIVVWRKEFRTDSGGIGKHRGGLGARYELELLEKNADVFLFGERGKYSPQGVFEGGEALPTVFTYEQDDGPHHPPMVSKMVGIKLKRGQKILLETPGGGGYGPVRDRKLPQIQRDLDLGYITPEAARETYNVALDANGSVDADKTAILRQEAAE